MLDTTECIIKSGNQLLLNTNIGLVPVDVRLDAPPLCFCNIWTKRE